MISAVSVTTSPTEVLVTFASTIGPNGKMKIKIKEHSTSDLSSNSDNIPD
jgi:hypothetical protein